MVTGKTLLPVTLVTIALSHNRDPHMDYTALLAALDVHAAAVRDVAQQYRDLRSQLLDRPHPETVSRAELMRYRTLLLQVCEQVVTITEREAELSDLIVAAWPKHVDPADELLSALDSCAAAIPPENPNT